jgi:hypothetical protein
MAVELADLIGNDRVPEAYRGFFDNADWTLHRLVVQGAWLFLVIAAIIHFAYLTFYHT